MQNITGSRFETRREARKESGVCLDSGFSRLETLETGEAGRKSKGGYLEGLCTTSFTRSYAKKAVVAAISAGLVFAAEPSLHSRTVTVHKGDIVPIFALRDYSTMIEIPEGEEIMAVSCGDKDSWAINYDANVVFVKPDPKRPGITTNVNLVTASKNKYSFKLREVSTDKQQQADLRVLLDQGEESGIAAIEHPAFVRAGELEALKASMEKQSQELAQTKKTAALSEVKSITHDYKWKEGKEAEAFGLKAIYHDDKFTYIEAVSQNAPALYQVLDGKESVVEYNLQNGKYIVPIVLEKAVLRAGKTKLEFERKG